MVSQPSVLVRAVNSKTSRTSCIDLPTRANKILPSSSPNCIMLRSLFIVWPFFSAFIPHQENIIQNRKNDLHKSLNKYRAAVIFSQHSTATFNFPLMIKNLLFNHDIPHFPSLNTKSTLKDPRIPNSFQIPYKSFLAFRRLFWSRIFLQPAS